jgi:tetratricopeptide (TPR) repeat protein
VLPSSRRLLGFFTLSLAATVAWDIGEFGIPTNARTAQDLGNEGYRRLWAGDSAAAIAAFRQALLEDPSFPYRWADLGEALNEDGRSAEARYCFDRAVALAPASPEIAMRAANYYFGIREIPPALRLGSLVLAEWPDFDDQVFSSFLRMGGDIHGVLDTGIGKNRRAAGSFFRFLLARGTANQVDIVGQWMEERGLIDRALGREWAVWLLAANRPAEAAALWSRGRTQAKGVYQVPNRIDNGGFEAEPTGKGFDWRVVEAAGAKAARDETRAHSGSSSLRLDFDGSDNIYFRHVSQLAWLEPGRYRLSAWVRTESLTTDRGVGLRIVDPNRPAALESFTEAVTGSADWTRVSTDFTVPAPARLATVEIVRQPSLRFDNRPRGTAWVDDVELRRLP